ncbi:DUF421 domain-containing protein [Curtobacterium sp. MCSS17_006]|uniref:DUF421 domain-containing protein n=1 Tax=unclassified Curtobacterium TaxID=257496 RepID=UPI000DA71254|nr:MULTISPECIES: YetF domain-containing protein [unclassified Curtobacterium]PZE32884.1 DUF421 domain-containing protein [Curtobacterium sp. MCSS17_006]WIB33257.1 DUF421 domain-containing protein [Curtobacterium sp. MCSS17_005]
MWERLGVDAPGVVAVVVAAIGVYVVFLLLIRVFGQRPLARLSTADLVVVLALGSITGRVVLGMSVTLTAGAVALVTLFLLRWAAERLGRTRWGRVLVRDRPVVLMAGPTVLMDALRRARISEPELAEALRTAGVRDEGEVACVVLESTGAISVVRKGRPLSRRIYRGLDGSERIPEELFG